MSPAIIVIAFVGVLLAPQGAGAVDGWPVGVELTNTGSGTRGWVRIADDDGLEPQVFTIEAWIRPLGGGDGDRAINGVLHRREAARGSLRNIPNVVCAELDHVG